MRATVLTDNLREGIGFVNHAVSMRSQLPILLNFLIQAKKGGLRFSATDLEIGITVDIPAKIEEEGETTVSAKTFFDLVSSIPYEKTTLFLKDTTLHLSSEKIESSFSTTPSSEFPKLFEEKGEKIGEISKENLSLLGKVVFAASDDMTSRPALSGILFSENTRGLDVVAADGYRLSLLSGFSMAGKNGREKLLLPARIIRELLSLKNIPESIDVFVSPQGGQVVFDGKDFILVGRLIEENFPDYEKIIPDDFSTFAVFDKEEALSAVKVCSVFAREAANIIRIVVSKGKVVFSSDASSVGSNSVEVEAKMEGEENEIAFNSHYLTDALSSMKEGPVRFEMTGPLSSGVFREEGNKNFLHIVMPIRVTG